MVEPNVEVGIEHLTLLEGVSRAAEVLGTSWFLTGAGGRVLLLEKLMNLPPGRATLDLDFGVLVQSWKEFEALKNQICMDDRFRPDPKQSQRLLCGEHAKMDIVPFGPIAAPHGSIQWPSKDGEVMNVLGFQEAHETAKHLRVNGELKVPVATARAMLMLKFIAWEDRHLTVPGKDASDIAYILSNGKRIIGQDAFYEEYSEATEAVGWDLDLASARVFGLQIADLAQAPTKSHLTRILNRETAEAEESLLVRELAASFPSGLHDPSRALVLLEQMAKGMSASTRSSQF